MKIEIEITETEINELKVIRNYFGVNDQTVFEHKAFRVLSKLVKNLTIPNVMLSAD